MYVSNTRTFISRSDDGGTDQWVRCGQLVNESFDLRKILNHKLIKKVQMQIDSPLSMCDSFQSQRPFHREWRGEEQCFVLLA